MGGRPRCNAVCLTTTLGLTQEALAVVVTALLVSRAPGPAAGVDQVAALVALVALAAATLTLGSVLLVSCRTPTRGLALVLAACTAVSVVASAVVGAKLVVRGLQAATDSGEDATADRADLIRTLVTAALAFAGAALGVILFLCGNLVMRDRIHEDAVARAITRGRNPSIAISEDGGDDPRPTADKAECESEEMNPASSDAEAIAIV